MTEGARPVQSMIGVVVVNYASHELLVRHLAELHLDARVRVVIVDNFHSVPARTAVSQLSARCGWDLVLLPDNRGFGAAVNAGAERAAALGCAALLMLNPDAQVSAEVIAELREQVLRAPDSVVTPRIVRPDGSPWFRGSTVELASGRITAGTLAGPGRRAWLPGTCLAMSYGLFERAGRFYEPYFLYWEDVDLSLRCAELGAELVIRADLEAVHDEGGTQGARRGRALSNAYYRYNCRNRLLFGARHLDRRTLLRWMLRTPAESWQILMRGGRRQLLDSPRPAWAALRGSLEGLGIAVRALVAPAVQR